MLLDVLVLAVVLLAAATGARQGGGRESARLVGLVAGGLAGWHVARGLDADPATPSALGPLVGLLLGALVGGVVAIPVGRLLRRALRRARLGPADALLGAALRSVLAVLACWMLVGAIEALGPAEPGELTDRSAVLRGTTAVLGQEHAAPAAAPAPTGPARPPVAVGRPGGG